MKEKYYSLQILRAVAAWMVVYVHYMQMFYGTEYDTVIGYFFRNYGGLGVDIFFVLSGFVMYFSASNTSGESFFLKRLFRVAPAYWFYTLLLVPWVAIFPVEYSATSYNITTLLASLLFIPTDNPGSLPEGFPFLTVGWTLNIEMVFYTVLTLAILLSRKKARLLCFIIILLSPLIVWQKNFPFHAILSSFYLYEFLAGFSIAFITNTYSKYIFRYRLLLSCLFLSIVVFCFKFGFVHIFYKILFASSLVFLAVLLNGYLNANNKIVNHLVKLGDFSYSTYLSHPLVLGLFLHYFGNNLSLFNEIAVIIGISIMVYFVSKYSYLFIEQNKFVISAKRYSLSQCNKL